MDGSVLVSVVVFAVGWLVRHMGIGAHLLGGPTGAPISPVVPPSAPLTSGLKGEIQAIVKDALEAAVAAAVADVRSQFSAPKQVVNVVEAPKPA